MCVTKYGPIIHLSMPAHTDTHTPTPTHPHPHPHTPTPTHTHPHTPTHTHTHPHTPTHTHPPTHTHTHTHTHFHTCTHAINLHQDSMSSTHSDYFQRCPAVSLCLVSMFNTFSPLVLGVYVKRHVVHLCLMSMLKDV